MSLEKIINKVKNFGKKFKNIAMTPISFKDIALFGSLSLLPIITGCDSIQQPLGLNINSAVTQSQETNFKGDTLYSSIKPLKQPYHGVRVSVAKPDSSWSDWEELTNNGNGTYIKTVSGNTIGEYFVKFQILNNYEWKDQNSSTYFKVHMDEAHSDDVLYNKCLSLMVNPVTAQDGEIIDVKSNLNVVFGSPPNLYNNDIFLKIRDSTAGGNQRSYIIDVQGDLNDTYNSQKRIDGEGANISYKHLDLEYTLSDYDLKNKIDDLNFNGWKKTL